MNTLEGPKQKAVYGKTGANIAAKLRKATADADKGLLLDAGNLTVGEYLDHWQSDCVAPLVEAGKLEHSTYVRYSSIVCNHLKPTLGRRRLKDLSRPEVRALPRVEQGSVVPLDPSFSVGEQIVQAYPTVAADLSEGYLAFFQQPDQVRARNTHMLRQER